MNFGVLNLDLDQISAFFNQGVVPLLGQLLALGGWLILTYFLFYAALHLYEHLREHRNTHHWRYIVLAIDIPAINIQTPKAVEQMFSHLAGAYNHPSLKEKLIDGFKQRWFSLEIISIEGYIQFIIWTEEAFRDLVEASIYAQYPDAEITEVEDYTTSVPDKFPNDTHDVWIRDFGLAEDSAYPIRSYREFEHAISKDTVLKDPMGTFLESFTRIGPGEQMWFQILVEPIGNDWKENAIKKIKEIIGEKAHAHPNVVDHLVSGLQKTLEGVGDQVFGREASEGGGHDDDSGPLNQIQYLTPGVKTTIEAMEMKISKIGFKTKMRGAYIGRKEVFNPARGVNAMIGALNQFNIPSANSIVQNFGVADTKARWIRRKNLLMKAYRKRKIKPGGKSCIMNIEELATIWHFPMSHVKTPLVQKASTKQAEPPSGLPVERILPASSLASDGETPGTPKKKEFKTDAGDTITYEDLF